MNCKPGDLAVIVDGDDCPQNVGRFVEVIERFFDSDYGWLWSCKPVTKVFAFNDGLGEAYESDEEVGLYDAHLKPIRDPGEDATDEMVALLGKPASQPSKEHA